MLEKDKIFTKIRRLILGEGCVQYNLKAWECPNFLFIVMGIITVIGIVATFFIGQRISNPDIFVPAVFFVALSIFVPGVVIVQSFERMANANKIKSEFMGIVSHQLRSPLSAMKWVLNMLMGGHVGEDKKDEYLNILEENNEHMITLVNDLLNVSRIDRGELKLEEDKIDLKHMVEVLVESIQPLAREKKIELKLDISVPKGSSVLGDEVYINMATTNFVDNAIRYSPENSTINIRLYNKDSRIRYEVKDRGRGIPEEDKKLIFNKFFRARNIAKKSEKGTGLGLFIAKAAIEQMGGEIGFKSKENKGTTFWYELPLAKKD
ncbi:MAG: HAMP domain-containing sensor histidine kinase [Candidatus Spechtbacterales bacterium]|nr:HAMP domain-containing sensor histidine kinase [Candidatus Spechtbacterales bacterium]